MESEALCPRSHLFMVQVWLEPLGQTAIGFASSPGATLGAGFWYGLGKGAYRLYLPVVLRKYD